MTEILKSLVSMIDHLVVVDSWLIHQRPHFLIVFNPRRRLIPLLPHRGR